MYFQVMDSKRMETIRIIICRYYHFPIRYNFIKTWADRWFHLQEDQVSQNRKLHTAVQIVKNITGQKQVWTCINVGNVAKNQNLYVHFVLNGVIKKGTWKYIFTVNTEMNWKSQMVSPYEILFIFDCKKHFYHHWVHHFSKLDWTKCTSDDYP